MRGKNASQLDRPVIYLGSYTCFIDTITIDIDRWRSSKTTVKLSTTINNIERDVLNPKIKQLLVQFSEFMKRISKLVLLKCIKIIT